jgi:transcriptional regulator with XRE-family HTH domain
MEASAPEQNRSATSPGIPDNLARDMDRDALSQLVRNVNDDGRGVSYEKMANRASAAGYSLSKPYFQKMATNAVSTAPTPERLRAIAAGLDVPLPVVQRAAAIQYLDYQATELAGYDDDIRVIVAHLAGMEKSERRRWQAMIEADERTKRDSH